MRNITIFLNLIVMIGTGWFIWAANGNVDMGGLGGAMVLMFVWLVMSGVGLEDVLKAKKAGNYSKKVKFLLFYYSLPFLIAACLLLATSLGILV